MPQRQFNCVRLWSSPETRAQESARALNRWELPIETKEELDDIFGPGAYKEGLTMSQLPELEGDYISQQQLAKKYDHETPATVIERMNSAFWGMVDKLNVGETGILVSHGDPHIVFSA